MTDDAERGQTYRERAQKLRSIAQELGEEELIKVLRVIAGEYEQMAARIASRRSGREDFEQARDPGAGEAQPLLGVSPFRI